VPEETELESTIPQPASLKALWRELRAQGVRIDGQGVTLQQILRALTKDPLDPASKDGLVQLQESHGRHIEDLENRVTELEDTEAKDGDWLRTALWDLAKMAGAAGLGAWLGKGGH
jgi:hypothetical protein